MGACDDITRGQSTFMKELQETSDIIKSATPRSLVILDELGRGTSTHDGTAIAYATLRYMVETARCVTLFVTHYPVLGKLERVLKPALRCCHLGFMEDEGSEDGIPNITFLYRLTDGLANRSYGLNVARLASLPPSVIETAMNKSEEFEKGKQQGRAWRAKMFVKLWAEATEQTVPNLLLRRSSMINPRGPIPRTSLCQIVVAATLVCHVGLAVASGLHTPAVQAKLEEMDNYCSPNGPIQDTFCEFRTVEEVNANVYPLIEQLVTTSYFRYFKVDLTKDCPFWNENMMCIERDCAVEEVDESQIPIEWKSSALSSVDRSMGSMNTFSLFQKKCEFDEKDFCVVDDDDGEGMFVDLTQNPERFTGYAGESAARVWRAVYKENCFEMDGSDTSVLGVRASDQHQCMEKRVFYRLISGLHSSISTHICDKHLNRKTGEWYPDLECFTYRLALYPERIENLYFTYVVLLRAIAKLSPFLSNYQWCTGNIADKTKIKSLVEQISDLSLSCPSTFDEKLMFADSSSKSLKEEFKSHFRNISRVMDCVGCEKCRLWGKLQVTGLGTALKILFSFGENPKEFRLTRTEIVSLFNGFGRLSDSLQAINRFRKQLHLKSRFDLPNASHPSRRRIAGQAPREGETEEERVERMRAGLLLDLSHVEFFEPRWVITWGIGLVIMIAGVVRIVQKGWQMERGTMKLPEGYEERNGIVKKGEEGEEGEKDDDEDDDGYSERDLDAATSPDKKTKSNGNRMSHDLKLRKRK
ncbi:hypothetical protein HK101_010851 [Irineochytrium annulatum]|nr:hypothetical protein HK101_010851 [Irineochytrium annulatum]